ncbi:replication protein [Massilia sp. Root335]|uniref:replication protein n=1 Tax=Massilia sp. Root335 TaxID=1736517 RepID=UPI0006F7633A|nr:replication protein [Massilia sp. Root335]
MSTPQLEDGFTMIANELLEAVLGGSFSHREQSVIFTIIRKTYGYGKKEDDMSAAQIGAMCGLARQHVTSTLNALAARNVITKRQGTYGMIVGVQKDHRRWISANQLKSQAGLDSGLADSPKTGLVPKQDTSQNRTSASPESGQVDSPKSGHTKENLPKENLKRKSTPKPPERAITPAKEKTITLRTFIDGCQERGERPVRDYEPLWRYTEGVGLPKDFIALAWYEFCRRFLPGGTGEAKRYTDWRKAFRKYVEGNYLKLWALDGESRYYLTTQGKQAQKFYDSREAA